MHPVSSLPATLPPNLLRIGDFSQLAQLTVPALRHYDEVGLLKPAYVDKFTDYRYYSLDQLTAVNRILALRDLGLSLDQIRRILHEPLTAGQFQAMLSARRAELARQISQEEQRLKRVDARLKHLTGELVSSAYEVVLKPVEAITIAATREWVPHVSQMAEHRSSALARLYGWLETNGISQTQVSLEAMHYHSDGYVDTEIDMEAAVVLTKAQVRQLRGSKDQVQVTVRDLPAEPTMASTIHNGLLWEIPEGIVALFAWIARNGFQSSGSIRELHHFGREYPVYRDESQFQPRVLELQIPVTKI